MPDELEKHQGPLAILQRNAFYRQRFHLLAGLCVLSALMNLVLGGLLHWIVHHPRNPVYFPADSAGRLIQEVPLDQPVLSAQNVANWVIHAVESTLSFDFVNYHSQLQNAEVYFSDPGWVAYMKGLSQSNNLLAFTQRKLVGIAKVTGVPGLLKVGQLPDGRLAWKFEMPVLMEYRMPPFDEKSVFYNPLVVTVVVRREDILEGNNGLGIVQMNTASAVSG